MMRKKVNYTTCTPIPSYIPRQLAVDLLHSHGELITVNPLVLNYKAIKAPPSAPADEYYSSWYEVEERVQFIPGVGKMGAGKIKFNGCFHDLPMGLQTHIYAPAGVETRNKYKICGNQPGEPREPVEMGIGAPPEGLYLREDVEIKCNITMASFVKKEQKAASKVLIERMLKKAELLEEGALQAMFEDGRIKTLNPADRTSTLPGHMPPGAPSSPRPHSMMATQGAYPQSYYDSANKHTSYQVPVSPSYAGAPHQQGGYYAHQQHPSGGQQTFAMELPGDMPSHSPMPSPAPNPDAKFSPPPTHLHPAMQSQPQNRPYSTISELSSDNVRPDPNKRLSEIDSNPRYSDADVGGSSTRPTSYSDTQSQGMRSPRTDAGHSSFASVPEEGPSNVYSPDSMKRLEGAQQAHRPVPPPPATSPPKAEGDWPVYNPADYA